MSYERTSSEVLNELVPLFIEYQQLLEKENKIKDDRIARLETEVVGLKLSPAKAPNFLIFCKTSTIFFLFFIDS